MKSPSHNIATPWARHIVRQLIASGVGHFFVSPGSRSTPLVVAILESGCPFTVHYDERGSAFAALGFAKSSGKPAAWVTTSGTAVANGYPAVVEAAISRVPMVLLTADRPPELRNTSANQTIDQVRMFGTYVRAFVDVPAPDVYVSMSDLSQIVAGAMRSTAYPNPGPVHLNCMFRKPLEPQPAGTGESAVSDDDHEAAVLPAFDPPQTTAGEDVISLLANGIARASRPLIAVGTTENDESARSIADFARAVGCPIIADVRSRLRTNEFADVVVGSHDLVLQSIDEGFPRPDLVISVGERLTSAAYYDYAGGAMVERYHVGPIAAVVNPTRLHQRNVVCDEGILFARLREEVDVPAGHFMEFMDVWKSASNKVEQVIDAHPLLTEELTEPSVARTVAALSTTGLNVLAASSMPVRDLNSFAGRFSESVNIFANRGASGIDGLVATAVGLYHGNGSPTAVLIGDLALLHDLNSLGMLTSDPRVILVVVNNDGGGIFSFLPIARYDEYFETGFGTPHGIGFRDATNMFGIRYENPSTLKAFRAAYTEAVLRNGATLIEVSTERATNLAVHREIVDACRKVLASS